MIQPQLALLVVGVFLVALPATAWTILYRRHDKRSVALWCSGSLLYGLAFVLVGLRETTPIWLSFAVANLLAFASYPVRAAALHRELERPVALHASLWIWAIASAAYLAVFAGTANELPRLLIALGANLLGAAWLAGLAWTLYRRRGYASARMLALADGLFVVALLARAVAVLSGWSEARGVSGSIDFAITLLTGVIAALYGNLGYVGIALEATRSEELQRTTELAREQERRVQTELRVREQSALLEERGQLLAQREEMLAALAHEVRQPLNNASAALQSASEALSSASDDPQAAAVRLQRANGVLMQITSALDNTLTDAVLLGDEAPLARQDVDIDLLVNLVIADVEPLGRGRVQRERTTNTRTASMNVGLMRLALRNLIANALAYSPPDAPVVVRIADSDEPLALVIEVSDRGSGFAPELLPRLFARGARGVQVHNRHGHGLGLYIVRRIMDMHQGEVRVQQAEHGLTMGLVIPQTFSA